MVDTGATSHIIHTPEVFKTFDKHFTSSNHVMELADGSKSTGSVKERGTASVMIRDDCNKICSANLSNSLFIPSYITNIFSVVSALKQVQL